MVLGLTHSSGWSGRCRAGGNSRVVRRLAAFATITRTLPASSRTVRPTSTARLCSYGPSLRNRRRSASDLGLDRHGGAEIGRDPSAELGLEGNADPTGGTCPPRTGPRKAKTVPAGGLLSSSAWNRPVVSPMPPDSGLSAGSSTMAGPSPSVFMACARPSAARGRRMWNCCLRFRNSAARALAQRCASFWSFSATDPLGQRMVSRHRRRLRSSSACRAGAATGRQLPHSPPSGRRQCAC